jgi:hypothetical protein
VFASARLAILAGHAIVQHNTDGGRIMGLTMTARQASIHRFATRR